VSPYLDLVRPIEPVSETVGVGPRPTLHNQQEQPRGRALRWSEVAKVLDSLVREGARERDGLRAAYRSVDRERYPEPSVLTAAERGVRLLAEFRVRLMREYGVGGERLVPIERVVREADRLTRGLPPQAGRERGMVRRVVERLTGRELEGLARGFER
jgi:hypothetical protein